MTDRIRCRFFKCVIRCPEEVALGVHGGHGVFSAEFCGVNGQGFTDGGSCRGGFFGGEIFKLYYPSAAMFRIVFSMRTDRTAGSGFQRSPHHANQGKQ